MNLYFKLQINIEIKTTGFGDNNGIFWSLIWRVYQLIYGTADTNLKSYVGKIIYK